MSITVEIDARGRVALGKIAHSGTYRASLRPDGAVVLEPARVLTETELAVLRHPEVADELDAAFAGTAQGIEYDWR